MVIRKVSKRGMDHKDNCEDSSLFAVHNDLIFMGVFDGCSSGTDSHFASILFTKIFKKSFDTIKNLYGGDPVIFANTLLNSVYKELTNVFNVLSLSSIEMLSTINIFVGDIKTKKGISTIIGDGSFYVNGKKIIDIDPPGNAPFYITYYIEKGIAYDKAMNGFFINLVENFNDVSVCSDGINTYKNTSGINATEFAEEYLLRDKYLAKNKMMLNRKCNILTKVNLMNHSDDLSVVRYIEEI